MDAFASDPAAVPRYRIARIIWGACLGAIIGYYAILVFLIPRELAGVNPAVAGQLGRVLLPVAGAATIFAWFVHRRLAESVHAALAGGDVTPRAAQVTLVPYVICWALGDGIAVLGLVAGVLGSAITTASVFFVWAAGVLVVTRPQPVHFPGPRTL
jgi:hypothetical protein